MLLGGLPPAARPPPSLLLRIPPSFPFDSMLRSLIPALSGETLPAIAQLADYCPGGDGSRPPAHAAWCRRVSGRLQLRLRRRMLEQHEGGRVSRAGGVCGALRPSLCPKPGQGETSCCGDS